MEYQQWVRINNYMKLLIKFSLIIGLLALFSCVPSAKKSVHKDTAFTKKIDSAQLKEQAQKLATDNTLVDALDETTEVKRRIDYINPDANKEESIEEAEEEVGEEEVPAASAVGIVRAALKRRRTDAEDTEGAAAASVQPAGQGLVLIRGFSCVEIRFKIF